MSMNIILDCPITDDEGIVGMAPRAARTDASLGHPVLIRRCLPGVLSASLLHGVLLELSRIP